MSQFQANFIATIIDRYGLELDGHPVDGVIETWLQKYDSAWIVKAIVEALYRGRYKIVSVENILIDWQRLGQPLYKFTAEYEREILQSLPEITAIPEAPAIPPTLPLSVQLPIPDLPVIQSIGQNSQHLNPEESAPFQHHHSIPADWDIDSQFEMVSDCESPRSTAADDLEYSDPTTYNLLTVLPQPTVGKEEPPAQQIVAQPAKFQLFNTLRAIVNSSICLPLAGEHSEHPRIAKFKLPTNNDSDGQYL